MKLVRVVSTVAVALVMASGAFAQSRGNLRITGKVVDEAGAPVQDAQVRAAKKGEAQPEVMNAKTNNKGEYTINGVAPGEWVIEAAKEGIGVREVSATLVEGERTKTVDITIAKPAPKVDPNVELQAEDAKALAMAKGGDIPGARKIYEGLIAKYPQVYQLQVRMFEMYFAENNHKKALEHITLALEKEPANTDWQLLQAELLMETGDKAGAEKVLQSVDMTKAKEPRAFINQAINYINSQQSAEAIDLLTKVMAQFPNDASIVYYRGKAYVAASKLPEAKADFEKFVASAPPDAPQMADAKKLLEQLNKK